MKKLIFQFFLVLVESENRPSPKNLPKSLLEQIFSLLLRPQSKVLFDQSDLGVPS